MGVWTRSANITEPIVLVAMVAWALAAWFVLFVLRLVFRPAG